MASYTHLRFRRHFLLLDAANKAEVDIEVRKGRQMSTRNSTATLAALLVLAAKAGAQTLLSSPAAAEPRPAIHATIDEVALDPVVRDKRGRLVKDLASGDVEIYEDGVRQQIQISGVTDRSTAGSASMTVVTGADIDNGPGANAHRGDPVIEREQRFESAGQEK
jgi:hypothetical protein